MFKKLLSLAALALCAGSMNAQFEAGKDYIFQNVEAGTFLCAGNDWATHASMGNRGLVFTAETSGDGFKLNSHTYNNATNHYLGENYVDNGGFVWTAEAAEGGYYIKAAGGTYLAPGTGTYAVTDATTPSVWKIIPVTTLLDGASASNPVDATHLIKDADFSRNHYNKSFEPAWEAKSYDGTAAAANYNLCGGEMANCCAESWRSSNGFNIYQTITVPNGIYKLTAQIACNDYNKTGNIPVLYANDKETSFNQITEGETSMAHLSASFTSGKYGSETLEVVVTDGSLTVGVKCSNTALWALWDNFELTYYGAASDDAALAAAKEAYEKANAAANAVDATQKMSASASQGLANAKDTYGDNSFSTVEAYETATKALNDAAKAANNSIADYASQKAQCDAYEKKADAAGLQDAMEDFSTEFWNCYNAGTLNGELSELIQEYGEQISALLQGCTNMTSKITNPSFEKNSVEGWTTIEGWQNANPYFHTNSSAQEWKDGTYFVEGWVPGGSNHGNETLTQTINNLPAGDYILQVNAKNEQQAGNTAGKGLFVTIGDKSYEVNSATGEECTVVYTLTEKGSITIGLKIEDCTGNWIAADNFCLYFDGVDTSVLEDKIKEADDLYETLDSEKTYAKDLKKAIDDTNDAIKTIKTAEDVDNLVETLQGYLDAAKLGARKDTYADMPEGQYIIAIQDEEDGTYKFLGAGNNWGTQASLIAHPQYVTITKAEDGKYYVESQVSNGGESKYFNGSWMDGAKTAFEFIGYSMIEGMDYYTVQLSNGTNYYYNNNGLVDNKAEADFEDEPQVWAVMSVETYEAMVGSDASEEDPADFTHRILDADLGRNNVNVAAWTITNATNPKTSGDVASANANFSIEAYKAKFNVVQTITDLPEGLYELKATAMYRQDGADPVLPYIFIEDAKADFAEREGSENTMQTAAASMATGLYTVSARAYVGEDGTIIIGAATEGTSCWAIFDNFQLYYLGEMDAESDYTRETPEGKYGTLCLPYAAASEDATIYVAAINGTEVELTEVSKTEAGKAYIYLANADEQTFTQATGAFGLDEPVASLPLVGVFAETTVPEGSYVLQTQDAGQNFYKVAEGSTISLGAYKAYLTASASGAKVLSFANATAIKAIDALVSGDAKIYDLNGRQLKSLQKGMNIVNGVKVMVK